MKLLELEKADGSKVKKEKESIERIRNLGREENRAVEDLNKARTDLDDQKAKITKETDDFVAEQKDRAIEAKREAQSIESFRKDVLKTLLKPVHEMEREAETRLLIAKSKEVEIDKSLELRKKLDEKLEAKKSELDEREKSIMKIAREFDRREKELGDRELHVKSFMAIREKRVKEELNRARLLLEESKNKK